MLIFETVPEYSRISNLSKISQQCRNTGRKGLLKVSAEVIRPAWVIYS